MNENDAAFFVAALDALRRARRRAVELARFTRTNLVIAVDGKVVRVSPDALD